MQQKSVHQLHASKKMQQTSRDLSRLLSKHLPYPPSSATSSGGFFKNFKLIFFSIFEIFFQTFQKIFRFRRKLLIFKRPHTQGWKCRMHFPDRRPEISKTLWPHLNSTQIRTQNYQNFDLTPPSGQKYFLKNKIFLTIFVFFGARLVLNSHQVHQMTLKNYCAP